MDPDKNLERQMELVNFLIDNEDEDAKEELEELIQAMDEWTRMGGFAPGGTCVPKYI